MKRYLTVFTIRLQLLSSLADVLRLRARSVYVVQKYDMLGPSRTPASRPRNHHPTLWQRQGSPPCEKLFNSFNVLLAFLLLRRLPRWRLVVRLASKILSEMPIIMLHPEHGESTI